ncbi:hypothetical protein ACRALDRAFT_1091147 [Sodiomyces alcalophilus JCM 7366]|uniref:uncharacterized protein n=1 Tax=Sodiomyces alcalophilus JCM 7366 TaxID=591952 RepID=UPI0039B5A35C
MRRKVTRFDDLCNPKKENKNGKGKRRKGDAVLSWRGGDEQVNIEMNRPRTVHIRIVGQLQTGKGPRCADWSQIRAQMLTCILSEDFDSSIHSSFDLIVRSTPWDSWNWYAISFDAGCEDIASAGAPGSRRLTNGHGVRITFGQVSESISRNWGSGSVNVTTTYKHAVWFAKATSRSQTRMISLVYRVLRQQPGEPHKGLGINEMIIFGRIEHFFDAPPPSARFIFERTIESSQYFCSESGLGSVRTGPIARWRRQWADAQQLI